MRNERRDKGEDETKARLKRCGAGPKRKIEKTQTNSQRDRDPHTEAIIK
jgi:hypothetical protein